MVNGHQGAILFSLKVNGELFSEERSLNGNIIEGTSEIPGVHKGNFTITKIKQAVTYKEKWLITYEYTVGSKATGKFYALLKEDGKWDLSWKENGPVDHVDYGDWKITGSLFILNWKEPSCCYGTYDGMINGTNIPNGIMTSSQGYMGKWTATKIK